MATKTKRPKPQPKKPTAEMVEAILASCEDEGCDHSFCAPDNLEPIKDYSIKITKSHRTMDGDYWEGIILLNGEPVIQTGNRGDGGPNWYHPADASDSAVMHTIRYKAAALQAFPRLKWEQEDALTMFLDICYQNFNA